MARVLVIGGLAALAFTVFAVVDCALTERARVRALPRALWVVVVLLLPVLGGALWLLLGRGPVVPIAVRRTTGPDDDPAFLRAARDRRALPAEPDWRLYEQELANHDADTDDDGEGRAR